MAYTITSGTMADRVLSILGEDNLDYFDEMLNVHELFEEAIWEVVTAVPERLLLTEIPKPIDPQSCLAADEISSDDINIYSNHILLVIRVEATTVDGELVFTRKNCTEIPYEESHRALDSDSIYFATKNSPVFWIEPSSTGFRTLKTAPATTGQAADTGQTALTTGNSGLMIFDYARETIGVTDSGSELGWNTMVTPANIPPVLEDIIIKRIALRVLDAKLASTATQDEDQEIFGILSGEKQILETDIKESLLRIQGGEQPS